MQSAFLLIPKVFSEVEALCRPLTILGKPCLLRTHFVHRGIVILEKIWHPLVP